MAASARRRSWHLGRSPLVLVLILILSCLLLLAGQACAIVTPDAPAGDENPSAAAFSADFPAEKAKTKAKQAKNIQKSDEGSGSSDEERAIPVEKAAVSEVAAAVGKKVEVYVEEARPIRGAVDSDEDFESIDIPSGLFEVVDGDSGGRRQNYASLDAGATILDSSAETKSPTSLLVPDKDRYMMTPCQNPQKWVVVSLSEDVQADAIVIANYEKFSSPVKDFLVLGSVNYPTDTWLVLGNFTAESRNGEQVFPLDPYQHVRYIKLRFFSHYGSEYYCTLSQLKVHGRTFTQVISQLEKTIDAEVVALEASISTTIAAIGEPTDKEDNLEIVDNQVSTIDGSGIENNGAPVCLRNDTAVSIVRSVFFGDEAYALRFGKSAVEDAPRVIQVVVPSEPSTDEEQEGVIEPEPKQESSGVKPPSPPTTSTGSVAAPSGPAAASVNATKAAAPSGEATAGNVAQPKANSTTATTGASTASPPTIITAATGISTAASSTSTQGLGRLENIFVRLTKKIQALEVNQSGLARHVEEFSMTAALLQAHQDGLASQLHEIRSMLNDLKTRVTQEFDRNERLLDQVRRDNIALWNEMLVVRDVITTMKAGILCAIILSALIITIYLLRLLLRCIVRCKERADLREWFWRTEAEVLAASSETDKKGAAQKDQRAKPRGESADLRVNRKQQFGKSWDDSAIERKTLYREVVDAPRRVAPQTPSNSANKIQSSSGGPTNPTRRHHHGRASKKARTSSLHFSPSAARVAVK